MVFSSLLFIFAFLPVVWVGFHLLKSEQFAKICDKFCAKFHLFIKPYTLAKLFLIAASLFFYAFWKLAYLPILLVSILVNFYLAKRILSVNFSSNASQNALAQNGGGGGDNPSNQSTQKNTNQTHLKPKFYFIIGVIFNLCLLGFFKYTDFFLENFNTFAKLAHLDFDIPLPHILLPLALSFVTFQQIAFLYDCYKRTKGQLRENLNMNFIDYALFISFFPQLIAGPIVHHREMMPQFARLGANSACSDFLGSASAHSLQRTASASHSFASHNPKNSSTILEFEDSNELSLRDLQSKSWQSTQICHISEKSKTPNCHIERSEISQTNSQRDFSPTAQNDKMRHFVCNDKKWNFAQNDSTYTMRFLKFTQTRLYKVLCWFLTFNFVSIAWVFFRAENLQGASNLLKGMFGIVWVDLPQKAYKANQLLKSIDGTDRTFAYIIIAILVCVFCKNSFEFMQNFHSKAFEFSIVVRVFSKKIWLKCGGVFVKFVVSVVLFCTSVWLLFLALTEQNAYSPFIYFNF